VPELATALPATCVPKTTRPTTSTRIGTAVRIAFSEALRHSPFWIRNQVLMGTRVGSSKWSIWRLLLTVAIAIIVGCSFTADSLAHLDVTTRWSLLPPNMGIEQISCPSADLCVADGSGESGHGIYNTMYSTDPGVGPSWKPLSNPSTPLGAAFPADSPITCPSTNLCLVVDDPVSQGQLPGGKVFAIRNPTFARARWKLVGGGYESHVLDTWASLSCPTAGFCAELDEKPESVNGKKKDGAIWISAHPALPGSWHQRALPFPSGGRIVCASERLCVAYRSIRQDEGQIAFLRDPLKSSSKWHLYTLPLPRSFSYIGSVSCVASGGCMLIGSSVFMEYASAGILMSPDVERGPGSWTTSPEGERTQFSSVGCLQSGTCYATTNFALTHPYIPGLVISSYPFSRTLTAWQSTAANRAGSTADPALTTCATPDVCFDAVVVPGDGNAPREGIETLRLSR
jgi:hypothetical protein